MFKFLHDIADEPLYINNFYHPAFNGRQEQQLQRQKKVAKVIKEMGNKYLLATPIQRIQGVKK